MQLFWTNCFKFTSLQLLLLFGLFEIIPNSDGANILYYVGGISSHSHQYGVEPLLNKLADRGHNVTIFSPLSRTVNHPKVHYFCPTELAEFHKRFLVDFGVVGLQARAEEKYSVRLFKTPNNYFNPCFEHNQAVLKSSEFKEWANSTSFDLVMMDGTCNEAAYSLVHKYGAKAIQYNPLGTIYPYDYDLFGIPSESSWFPSWDNNYEGDMALFDRIFNTYTTLHWHLTYTWSYLPRIEKVIREEMVITKPMPLMVDLIKHKTDLILSSQHFSDQFAKSLPPFVVPVGGMHLQDPEEKLDSEIEKFIRGAKDGFVYISFGSIITISTMPPNLLEVFFETLQSFQNLRFLWKWEGPLPDNVPPNILFKPWFAQNDVLAHPKIKGIIFQGGQVTNQQAIFYAVPLIVFPVNGDQDLNAKRIRHTKNGIDLEFYQLSVSDLTKAIKTILKDKSYAAKSRHLSDLTRDRPMQPLDTAVWWTEYVLRHGDHSQLKPLSFYQPWWKLRSIDVWASIFTVVFMLILALGYMIVTSIKLYRFLRGRSSSGSSLNKHKRL